MRKQIKFFFFMILGVLVSSQAMAGWFRTTFYDTEDSAAKLQVSLVEENGWQANTIPRLSTCHGLTDEEKGITYWVKRFYPTFKISNIPEGTKYIVIAFRGKLNVGTRERWEVNQVKIPIELLDAEGKTPVTSMSRGQIAKKGISFLVAKENVGPMSTFTFCVRNLDGEHDFFAEVFTFKEDGDPKDLKATGVGELKLGTM